MSPSSQSVHFGRDPKAHSSEKSKAQCIKITQLVADLQSLISWASLVVQWLRIHLPMQGTRVRALVREDPTCRGATKPVRHNY